MDDAGVTGEPRPRLWHHIAVRLADEGVPIKAMARSLFVSYTELMDHLKEAKDHGMILTIPRDDWPVGSRREDRLPDALPLEMEDTQMTLLAGRVFGLGPAIARMLVVLLRRAEMTKQALHLATQGEAGTKGGDAHIKTVDVQIHKLRQKLTPHGIIIETIWGRGYYVPKESKALAFKVMDIPGYQNLSSYKGDHVL